MTNSLIDLLIELDINKLLKVQSNKKFQKV